MNNYCVLLSYYCTINLYTVDFRQWRQVWTSHSS